MSIPDTLAGVLVVLLGVLPGIPGDFVYRMVVGVSWREREFRYLTRLVAFSTVGLFLYAIAANQFGWTTPDHVIPSTFTNADFSSAQLPALGRSYIGHLVGATLAGLLSAGGLRLLARVSPVSTARDAWDHLIHVTVQDRWALVSLSSGDTYVGMIDHADISTEPEFRDLILAEPYRYNERTSLYEPTYQQHLYLRGSDISSIATVYDPRKDAAERIVPINRGPFNAHDDVPREGNTTTDPETGTTST